MKRILFSPDANEATGTVSPSPAPESAPAPAVKLTPEQEKKAAIQAWHDCKTREELAAVVEKYPVLKTIYSAANYN